MKQFGLEDIPKKASRKGGKKQRKTQQQKKAERPPKKTSTPPPQISHQNDSASSQQKQKELPPSTSFANDADERGFILVSHKKKNRKATPKRPLKTKRLPLKIVVFPLQASHNPKVSTFITPQEKKKAPEELSLVFLSSSTRLLDSKTYNASPVDDDSSEKRELDLQEYKAMQERLACLEAAAQGDVNIKAALQMMQRVKAAEDLLRAFLHDSNSGEATRLLLNKLMTERTNHKKSSLLLTRENDDLKQTVREQQQIIEGLYYERDRLHHTLCAWQHDASYQNHMMLVEQQEVRRLQQENKLLRQRLFSTQQRTSLTRTTQHHY